VFSARLRTPHGGIKALAEVAACVAAARMFRRRVKRGAVECGPIMKPSLHPGILAQASSREQYDSLRSLPVLTTRLAIDRGTPSA
jgi:hypothetical protein